MRGGSGRREKENVLEKRTIRIKEVEGERVVHQDETSLRKRTLS